MFRIKDNVLIGKEVPIRDECTNVGALVLEKLRSKPEIIAQVIRYSLLLWRGCRQTRHWIDFNVNSANVDSPLNPRSFDPQCVCVQVEAVNGTKTTFAEMTEKSVKCALWLREQAVQPGDIIGICTHNHLESYVPLLAALYVGAISNSWGNELSPSTLLLFSRFSSLFTSLFSRRALNHQPPNEIRFSARTTRRSRCCKAFRFTLSPF